MKEVMTIGIAGGTASGKTSISKQIRSILPPESSFQILKMDDYYKDQSHIDFSERVKVNYDHPFAFDIDLLMEHIRMLKMNQTIEKPIYDYINHTRSGDTLMVLPCDVLIIEGLFCLEEKSIRDELDIKIFVDTPADVRFIRRLLRDVNDRGRSLESIVNQYMNTVRVMHDLFVEPSKRYADIIIPEGGQNKVAIDLLTTKITSILNEKDVL